ncbi:MAG: cardiolipin synthase [Bacteroidales bacterium]|nr:cardiolipin synthase [Bacteroidales bacterium]
MLQLIATILYIILILTVVVIILVDKGDAGRKFAWLLIIVALPVLGILLYFLVGINYRHHWIFDRRHQKYKDIFEKGTNDALNSLLFGHEAESLVREDFRLLAVLMGRDAYPTVSSGNDFEIITRGKRKFELLCEDILQAKEYIHMEYFKFGNDEGGKAIKELLMKKAREGVKVRFILENIANFPIRPRYYNAMREAGVEVVRFTNPRLHFLKFVTSINFRNHRKIVVIDGKIGYTGGMNINDNYFNLWRDTHLRITGPAVASLQYAFMDSWLTAGAELDRPLIDYYPAIDAGRQSEPGRVHPRFAAAEYDLSSAAAPAGKLMQIVPDEPDLPMPMLLYSYEWAIQHARKYIWLQTPYFVPPDTVLDAMKIAALSGVDIRIMLPERADNFITRPANRAYYEEILRAGVRLFLRQGEFIHSKTFVCDDYLSSIGSANIDSRSFDINYEINTYIYDEETARKCKAIYEADLEKSRELTLDEWSKRPWHNRLAESIIQLLSPLL